MRVAMVGQFPASLDKPVGGVEAVFANTVHALLRVRPDLDVHVVRWSADRAGESYPQGAPPYTVHNVRPGLQGLQGLWPRLGPRPDIQKVLDRLRPDVVHVQAMAFLVDGRRYPSVLTIHGILERDVLYRRPLTGRLRSWLLGMSERPARARYGHITLIAGYPIQYLGEGLKGLCHLIPNPVEDEFFEIRHEESGPRILFVGPIIPLKNVHGLIEAAAVLARQGVDFQWRMAGPRTDPPYGERCDALVARHGLGERVVFLGNLDRTALRQELARARCLVLASFQENAPMAVSEAQAAGVPVVVSPAGGTAEMIGGGHCGNLVSPYNAESIADGVRLFLEDPDWAAEIGRRGRERAQVHRPERVAGQTLAVYDRIVRERAGG